MHFVHEIYYSWTSKTKNVRLPFQLFLLFTFALLCLCFVFCFVFLPVLRVVSLWLCIQHIWPVALAHTHTKGKLNTWVPLLYTHLSLARIVLYSCWFIPLPALSVEDPFQVTIVMESIFTACWIGTGVWLCHLILGFNSEELCNGGNLVWIKSEPGSATSFFSWYLIILNNFRWIIWDLAVVYCGDTIGFSGTLFLQTTANLALFCTFWGKTADMQRETPGLHF